jgi:apolipoprotein N-acyltransferase
MWTGVEWVRGWIFTGFPWLAAGYAQVPAGPLAGFAPIVGVYGVSWLTALSAGTLIWLLRNIWLPGKWLVPFATLVLLLGAGEGLKYIEWTEPAGKPLTVALVQGNIPQEMKWRPERAAQTLAEYAAHVDGARAQLVVLPETAFPVFYDNMRPSYLAELRTLARERGADILAGVPTGDISGNYYNSVVSLGTSPEQFYHKQHLVAFGEFIPPGFGWIIKVLHIPLSDFARGGKNQAPINVAGQKVAVNICYEDVFGEEIIRPLPQATLLVNVTNDAWFGDSFAGWQHAQMSQMRALESGRTMLRATNTGVTAIIDQKGRVVAALPEFTTSTLQGEAQGFSGVTPYARWGNAPVVVLLMSLLAVVALRQRP